MNRQITNTTREALENPLVALLTSRGGGIEASERRGQSEFVSSEQLPADCRGKEKLEAAGVVFGKPVSGDPMFCHATLPKGWKKVPTDHAMWSELVDENGVKRASIFYKAAFYDRSAFMSAI